MPRPFRIALILLVGLGVIAGLLYYRYTLHWDRHWGSVVPLEQWGSVPVHVVGEGPTTVIILHGHSSSPSNFRKIARDLAARLPVRVVLPQGEHQADMGGWKWFLWPQQAGGEEAWVRNIHAARERVFGVIAHARRTGAEKVVLGGASMGARMSMDVALSLDPPADAVVFLSGSSLPTWNVNGVLGQHVFMSHGRQDEVLEFEHAEQIRDRLRTYGAEVTWFEYEGGHSVRPAVDAMTSFLESVAEPN